MLMGTAKGLPAVADASRLMFMLNDVVARAARLAPTGTMMSPTGSDWSSKPESVLSDQPCTLSPDAVTRTPFRSTRKLPARVKRAAVGSDPEVTGESSAV
jgi:hypothetical protein